MIKQAVLASKYQGPIFMFGVLQVPRNEKEACGLDQKHAELGLPKGWEEAEKEEIAALDEYEAFYSHRNGTTRLTGHC